MENEGIVPISNGVIEFNMDTKAIDIYFFPPSPPSRAVLMLMKALNLEHNVKTTNLMAGDHMKPEFLKMNPLHTIPVINDNGFTLYDSHVIMKYLVDQYAKDDALFPKDPKKSALVNLRCQFSGNYLFTKFRDYVMPTVQSGQVPSDQSLKELEDVLQLLNSFLENQMYVAGENLTVADFSIITIITTIDACGCLDITQYHNVWLWYQRTKNAMKGFGYEEVNQTGANAFGQIMQQITILSIILLSLKFVCSENIDVTTPLSQAPTTSTPEKLPKTEDNVILNAMESYLTETKKPDPPQTQLQTGYMYPIYPTGYFYPGASNAVAPPISQEVKSYNYFSTVLPAAQALDKETMRSLMTPEKIASAAALVQDAIGKYQRLQREVGQ
ncbi:unnamed protein product [Ceutorhynchus assimilis]|uniref:Uncharacterized protein n=1 Tax=Ceutorhynchus assimilis TaxID=467358 RepID=A0A9N9MIJ6_9CUCU|nr:unnamed protein product [Ceutorhynchus assimilis]